MRHGIFVVLLSSSSALLSPASDCSKTERGCFIAADIEDPASRAEFADYTDEILELEEDFDGAEIPPLSDTGADELIMPLHEEMTGCQALKRAENLEERLFIASTDALFEELDDEDADSEDSDETSDADELSDVYGSFEEGDSDDFTGASNDNIHELAEADHYRWMQLEKEPPTPDQSRKKGRVSDNGRKKMRSQSVLDFDREKLKPEQEVALEQVEKLEGVVEGDNPVQRAGLRKSIELKALGDELESIGGVKVENSDDKEEQLEALISNLQHFAGPA